MKKVKRKYIVTCDLAKRFHNLRYVGVKTMDLNKFFGDFDDNLIKRIQKAYPEDEVIAINVEDMAADILKVVTKKQKETNGFVVSTSVDFAVPRRGIVLEVNRIINEKGEIIGLGPRPGHYFLEKQFGNVAKIVEKRPIIIVEDGIFSGGTIKKIVKGIRKYCSNSIIIVVGFAFPEGEKTINRFLEEKIITDYIPIRQLDNLIDWMPDHDFFPFAPNCGRVFGVSVNGDILPFYNHEGLSYSVPYIFPFAPIEKWASIPKEDAFPLSFYCLDTAVSFYSQLDYLNKKKIKIRDVFYLNPRISAPISVNPTVFLNLNENIGGYLRSVHSESW